MLSFLITLLVALLILGLLFYLITMLPLQPPFLLAARVVFIIICILVIAYIAAPWIEHPALR